MRYLSAYMAIGCALSVSAGSLLATPLNLAQGFPDIQVASNAIRYNAGTQQFTATGRPITFTTPTSNNITNTTTTSYSLTATIDHAGAATSGTLTIGGKIAALGATSGTLLTGTLSSFGSGNSTNGDPFEFMFLVTGGDLAPSFGSQAGIIISAKSTTYSDWSHDFSNGSGATNDTFKVPEPASLVLILAGLTLVRRSRGS